MKRLFTIAALLISSSTFAQNLCHSKAHIGFCYPLSTHGIYARDYSNTFSIHALVGVSGYERAFCVAGLANIIYNNSRGFVAGGFSNHISGSMKGVVASGFINTINYSATGAQLAGFANISGRAKGVQLAGFCNINRDNMTGVQAAGFMNYNGKNIRGSQLAGYVNIADTVNTQVSGFINVAKVAKVQVSGFMNIADSCDYPLGIINIIHKGEKSIGLSLDANKTSMVSFRSGGRVLYGIVGVGYNYGYNSTNLFALESGIGAHLRVSKNVRVNLEATSASFTDFIDDWFMTSSLRVLPTLSFSKHIELFAGPAINSVQSDAYSGEQISNHYIWSDKSWGMFNGVYITAYAGLHYRF